MPIRVDDDLPVKKILEDENIFVMGSDRAIRQDIRPLDILILNLMPLKAGCRITAYEKSVKYAASSEYFPDPYDDI